MLQKVADDLERLLLSAPGEEAVQQFLTAHPCVFYTFSVAAVSDSCLTGMIPKFAVTPGRIADFALFRLLRNAHQSGSFIGYVELKHPDTSLFVQHGRMSRELNDAWMECQDSIRLTRDHYSDILRRAARALEATPDVEAGEDFVDRRYQLNYDTPRIGAFIVAGRRSSLDANQLSRLRELSDSTHYRIRVLTYDSLLDGLRHGARVGQPCIWW